MRDLIIVNTVFNRIKRKKKKRFWYNKICLMSSVNYCSTCLIVFNTTTCRIWTKKLQMFNILTLLLFSCIWKVRNIPFSWKQISYIKNDDDGKWFLVTFFAFLQTDEGRFLIMWVKTDNWQWNRSLNGGLIKICTF